MTVFRFLDPGEWDGMEVASDQMLRQVAASRGLHFDYRDDGVYEMTKFRGARVAEIVDVVEAVLFKIHGEAALRETLSFLEDYAERIRAIVRNH